MGEPKHLLRLAGRTFLERIVGALEANGLVVAVSGSGALPGALEGIERIADAPGIGGALGGVVGALAHDRESAWMLVPCDVPLLTAEAIGWLIAQRERGAAGVMGALSSSDDVEPLPGVYEPSGFAALERLARDGSALRALCKAARVCVRAVPEEHRACWRNVNLREDLRDLGDGGGVW
ncbi:MAG: NTP transferase domain-containing protein [Phycisphaerales bacterium]|nr:NTP transferase domain-containing protein [Phycisphaerales bacterium]